MVHDWRYATVCLVPGKAYSMDDVVTSAQDCLNGKAIIPYPEHSSLRTAMLSSQM